jgi:hypothetical protein
MSSKKKILNGHFPLKCFTGRIVFDAKNNYFYKTNFFKPFS